MTTDITKKLTLTDLRLSKPMRRVIMGIHHGILARNSVGASIPFKALLRRGFVDNESGSLTSEGLIAVNTMIELIPAQAKAIFESLVIDNFKLSVTMKDTLRDKVLFESPELRHKLQPLNTSTGEHLYKKGLLDSSFSLTERGRFIGEAIIRAGAIENIFRIKNEMFKTKNPIPQGYVEEIDDGNF